MTLQSTGAGLGDDELRALAPWFHNLHLPDGRQTAPDHPLGDFPAFKWSQIASALPSDMSGLRALDIGCNAGYYSLALVERAAGGDETAFRKYFRRDLHAGLVRNLRKVGVLTPRIEPDIASLGISLAA